MFLRGDLRSACHHIAGKSFTILGRYSDAVEELRRADALYREAKGVPDLATACILPDALTFLAGSAGQGNLAVACESDPGAAQLLDESVALVREALRHCPEEEGIKVELYFNLAKAQLNWSQQFTRLTKTAGGRKHPFELALEEGLEAIRKAERVMGCEAPGIMGRVKAKIADRLALVQG